ncbi:four helix bundle protein [bacterium]|nr:four helix bundle protein [bacterium]
MHSEIKDSDIIKEPNVAYSSDRDFTSLIAWKKCRELKKYFYSRVLNCLPNEEKYNLDLQIRRAAISSTANIACPVE